jgi:histidinol-phosphate/aromatic aminotransferase/cobyric acid decarboxylase-like protein
MRTIDVSTDEKLKEVLDQYKYNMPALRAIIQVLSMEREQLRERVRQLEDTNGRQG